VTERLTRTTAAVVVVEGPNPDGRFRVGIVGGESTCAGRWPSLTSRPPRDSLMVSRYARPPRTTAPVSPAMTQFRKNALRSAAMAS